MYQLVLGQKLPLSITGGIFAAKPGINEFLTSDGWVCEGKELDVGVLLVAFRIVDPVTILHKSVGVAHCEQGSSTWDSQ